jgi:hypothetical protein
VLRTRLLTALGERPVEPFELVGAVALDVQRHRRRERKSMFYSAVDAAFPSNMRNVVIFWLVAGIVLQ